MSLLPPALVAAAAAAAAPEPAPPVPPVPAAAAPPPPALAEPLPAAAPALLAAAPELLAPLLVPDAGNDVRAADVVTMAQLEPALGAHARADDMTRFLLEAVPHYIEQPALWHRVYQPSPELHVLGDYCDFVDGAFRAIGQEVAKDFVAEFGVELGAPLARNFVHSYCDARWPGPLARWVGVLHHWPVDAPRAAAPAAPRIGGGDGALPAAAAGCARCGRDSHTASHCYASTGLRARLRLPSRTRNVVVVGGGGALRAAPACSRCGRGSHATSRCYATTYVDGSALDSDDADGSLLDSRDEDYSLSDLLGEF